MRRRTELARQMRVRILKDRRNGLTYEEIQRKRKVSSRTIANLVQGKDPKRFCEMCAETDPQKLEEHHPDRENYPNVTRTLCASCHSKVTREEQRTKKGQAQRKVVMPKVVTPQQVPAAQPVPLSPRTLVRVPTAPPVRQTETVSSRPLTPDEWPLLGRVACYGGGGVALGEGLLNRKLPWWGRLLLFGGAAFSLWLGSKFRKPAEEETPPSELPRAAL